MLVTSVKQQYIAQKVCKMNHLSVEYWRTSEMSASTTQNKMVHITHELGTLFFTTSAHKIFHTENKYGEA